MADSNITKRALAASLKELMMTHRFEHIQVTHICERCGMNRKSFYYHFKDKYDLLNWIFDTEFGAFEQNFSDLSSFENRLERIREICQYFYVNRIFYRNALQVTGQNSFGDHFQECMIDIIKKRLSYYLVGEVLDDFEVLFFSDALFGTFKRWLSDENCMPPDEFVDRLLVLFQKAATTINQELSNQGPFDQIVKKEC